MEQKRIRRRKEAALDTDPVTGQPFNAGAFRRSGVLLEDEMAQTPRPPSMIERRAAFAGVGAGAGAGYDGYGYYNQAATASPFSPGATFTGHGDYSQYGDNNAAQHDSYQQYPGSEYGAHPAQYAHDSYQQPVDYQVDVTEYATQPTAAAGQQSASYIDMERASGDVKHHSGEVDMQGHEQYLGAPAALATDARLPTPGPVDSRLPTPASVGDIAPRLQSPAPTESFVVPGINGPSPAAAAAPVVAPAAAPAPASAPAPAQAPAASKPGEKAVPQSKRPDTVYDPDDAYGGM